MPKSYTSYSPEFRRRMLERVRSGRSLESLAEEYEPSAQTIPNWLRQAERDEGKRSDGLTTAEREELRRLKREVRTLREERAILAKPRPGSRRKPARSRPGLRVRERAPGPTSGGHDVPGAEGLHQRAGSRQDETDQREEGERSEQVKGIGQVLSGAHARGRRGRFQCSARRPSREPTSGWRSGRGPGRAPGAPFARRAAGRPWRRARGDRRRAWARRRQPEAGDHAPLGTLLYVPERAQRLLQRLHFVVGEALV